MKILMCNSFNYLRGGAERCFIELSELLTERGHEVIPFCMEDERNLPSPYAAYFTSHIDFPTQMQKQGIKPKLTALARVIYSREAQRNIARLIADTQPDIAHVHGIAHETSPSILPVIRRAGIPIVQTLHDYKLICPNTTFVSHGEICESCRGHRYYNVARKRCKRDSLAASTLAAIEMYAHKATQIYERHVDTFIAPSAFLRDKVAEYGIKNSVVHIPNFIDASSFPPHYEPENYFVYCGRFTQEKGILTLLAAMKHVSTGHLYIAGRGDLEPTMRDFLRDKDIENVTFLGHLNTAKLIELVQKALFMVTPSEWYENYPMSVLEAFSCGTPVVGANIGGIPEQVIDGQTGLLFASGNVDDLAQKMNQLLQAPDYAVTLGRNARRQVEKINSPDEHYKQTLDVYQSVLAEAHGREVTYASA